MLATVVVIPGHTLIARQSSVSVDSAEQNGKPFVAERFRQR